MDKVSPHLCYLSEFTQISVSETLYDLIKNLPALSKQWALIPGSVIRAGSKYLLCLKANPPFSVGSQLHMVATDLENLEKSGNLKETSES